MQHAIKGAITDFFSVRLAFFAARAHAVALAPPP